MHKFYYIFSISLMEEIGIYHEHRWCIYSPLFYQNNSGEKWSTHLQYDCSAMTHVPPFWHCPGRQELWHSTGRWAGHLQSGLLEFWHGVQKHKSTSHRRPVNRGGQLQTRSLAPGVHVPAMAMLWKKCIRLQTYLLQGLTKCNITSKLQELCLKSKNSKDTGIHNIQS